MRDKWDTPYPSTIRSIDRALEGKPCPRALRLRSGQAPRRIREGTGRTRMDYLRNSAAEVRQALERTLALVVDWLGLRTGNTTGLGETTLCLCQI